MKTPLLLLLLASLALAVHAEVGSEVGWDRDGDGRKAFSYVLTKSLLDRQPPWKPGAQPCPLPLDTAIGIAMKWLEHQPWKDTVLVQRIDLLRAFGGEHWYYSISFDLRAFSEAPPPGGVNRHTHPGSVLIMLDGTIVEGKDLRKKPKK